MTRKRGSLSDQIRRAVKAAGVSRYRLCKAAVIHEASISRFMSGTVGLTMKNLDSLAHVLGLDVAAGGPAKVPPGRPRGRPSKKVGKRKRKGKS